MMYQHSCCGANPGWRHDDLNKSGCHVVDESRYKPFTRQGRDRPKRSNVRGNRGSGISDRFSRQFPFRYLKIVRQHCGIARKASDAAIGVLKYDEVKFTAATRNLPGNFTNSPK
jgi:hypothetical protein